VSATSRVAPSPPFIGTPRRSRDGREPPSIVRERCRRVRVRRARATMSRCVPAICRSCATAENTRAKTVVSSSPPPETRCPGGRAREARFPDGVDHVRSRPPTSNLSRGNVLTIAPRRLLLRARPAGSWSLEPPRDDGSHRRGSPMVDPWVTAVLVYAPVEFTRQKSTRLLLFRSPLSRENERRTPRMLPVPRRRR